MNTFRRVRKVLFLLPNSDEFGGLERHLLQLLERLLRIELQVHVICFGVDVISDRLDTGWRSRVHVDARPEPVTLVGWARLLREIRPDVVVFCYGWILSFPWQAIFAAILVGIRRRFSIQHLVLPAIPPPYPGRGVYGALRRRFGERARRLSRWRCCGLLCTKTICVSEAVRTDLVKTLKFPQERTVTIHNGVCTSSFAPSSATGASVRARFGITPEEFVLICTARLSKVKGVDVVIRAVSRALQRGVPCKCIIVGDGPLRCELMKQSDELDLAEQVIFAGFQQDVLPLLQAASAFILTSHTEGLPLSVLEAMACGLPCIVTNVGGTAEAVEHGMTGLVIKPASIEEAENAIIELATNPAECAKMGSRARTVACDSFNLDTQMQEIVNVLLS